MNSDAHSPPEGAGDKKRLRSMLREARRGLDDEARRAAAHGLLARLLELPEFVGATRIAIYLPNDGEIDTRQVIRWCHQNDRQPCLPVIQRSGGKNWLLFAELKSDTRFEPNNLGIPEPVVDAEDMIEARDLDLVLLPLVGFDEHGNRVGMGGGFYDTTFEFVRNGNVGRPRLVGIAHEVQKVPQIDVESWDIPLPLVVTGEKIYRFSE